MNLQTAFIIVITAANLSTLAQSNPVERAIERRKAAAGDQSSTGGGQSLPSSDAGGGRRFSPGYGGGPPYLLSLGIDVTNGNASLTISNTTATNFYQLWSTTNLAWTVGATNSAGLPLEFWTPGEIIEDMDGTNQITFDLVAATYPAQFFQGVGGNAVVSIALGRYSGHPITEPSSSNTTSYGYFTVTLEDSATTNTPYLPYSLHVVYRVSGTASNGVDYSYLSGLATITNNTRTVDIGLYVLYNTNLDFDQSVILSLVPTNGYLVDITNGASATNTIIDYLGTNAIFAVVTNIYGPIGIDYEPATTTLILSYNEPYGTPDNFALLDTNVVLTPWSGVSNLTDEIKIAVAKRSVAGFTNGDMFYGTGNKGKVGWLSAEGTAWNTNWATLTNENDILRGSLYVDQTGIFSNDLIAVTGNSDETLGERGVWRVGSHGNSLLITNIVANLLEGVITLTNDVQKWGPWAGKIITGDEDQNVIYAVAPNGSTTAFNLGIAPEAFLLIPTNQDLYISDFGGGQILKVSRIWFTNFVGDLLIVQSGEASPPTPGPQLFIVKWDSNTGNFVTWDIGLPPGYDPSGNFEGAAFAPINIPSQPLQQ